MNKSKDKSNQANITADNEGALNNLRGIKNLLCSISLASKYGSDVDDKHSYLLLSQNLANSINKIERIKKT